LTGEQCAALEEAAVALMNEYRLQTTEVPVDPVGVPAGGTDEHAPIAIHSIPLIITDSEGETRQLEFPLYDTVDPETQVLMFCEVNNLVPAACTSLTERALELFASYENFLSLLKREPVKTKTEKDARGQVPEEDVAVIMKLPVQIEAEGEYVSEVFTLVDGADPLQQAQLFCNVHAVPDEFCEGLIGLAVEQYNDFTVSTMDLPQAVQESEESRNEDSAATEVDSVMTNPAASTQPAGGATAPLVLDILRWGLSSDFLPGTAGSVTRDESLSATTSTPATAGTNEDVQGQNDAAANHIAPLASFALSDEYFTMLREKVV